MSYGFIERCYDCVKKNECIDRHIIQGAIYSIHSLPYGKYHLGAGNIELQCVNKVPMKEEE